LSYLKRGACEARLTLESPWARALREALEPDNAHAPEGIRVTCKANRGGLYCEIRAECRDSRGILRLRNTIDDLIENAKAALEALEASSGPET